MAAAESANVSSKAEPVGYMHGNCEHQVLIDVHELDKEDVFDNELILNLFISRTNYVFFGTSSMN
jgi:hypothetical protein